VQAVPGKVQAQLRIVSDFLLEFNIDNHGTVVVPTI